MTQTVNNNLSVLPWYTDISLQNNRKSYAFGAIYPLLAPPDRLLPFQIIRSTRLSSLNSCYVCSLEGEKLFAIGPALLETGYIVKKYNNTDSLIYYGDLPLGIKLLEGQYYLLLSDGTDVWYSEVFTVVNNLSDCIKLEWWDDRDLVFDSGRIVYDDRFVNKVYLQTELGKPEYLYEEEGETRDGYFFPETRTSEKKYKFSFLAPEYLCDALRIATIADHVRITDNYGQIYDCDTIKFSVEWQEQGDIALVSVEFETNTVIKKIGKGYPKIITGDFSDQDFNGDFYTKDTSSLPVNLITIHTKSYTITSENPVASDVNVFIRFVDIDGEEYGYADKVFTLLKGTSSVKFTYYEDGIGSYSIQGKSYDDTYNYILTLTKD